MFGVERRRLGALLEKPGVGALHLNVLERIVEGEINRAFHVPISIDKELLKAKNAEYLKLVEKYKRPALNRTHAIVASDRELDEKTTGKTWSMERIMRGREEICEQEAGIMAIESELLPPLVEAKLVKIVGSGYKKSLELPLLVSAQKLREAIQEAKKKK